MGFLYSLRSPTYQKGKSDSIGNWNPGLEHLRDLPKESEYHTEGNYLPKPHEPLSSGVPYGGLSMEQQSTIHAVSCSSNDVGKV
jgi:hypothetical protein